jgi:hypothetical protein
VTIVHDSADGRPRDMRFVPGENLVVEARDVAGNGRRRAVSFRLYAAARRFAAHLVARDAAGRTRSSFAPGEHIELVLECLQCQAAGGRPSNDPAARHGSGLRSLRMLPLAQLVQ